MSENISNAPKILGKFTGMIWKPMNSKTYLELLKLFLNTSNKYILVFRK
jgi:hypothetical protein